MNENIRLGHSKGTTSINNQSIEDRFSRIIRVM